MENRKATEAGRDVTMQKEDFAALWKTIHLKVTDTYEVPPEILWVNGSTIGTLGNFSASTGKAKSKKTFNISAIVAAALKNDEVLKYSAYLPPNKRKILYVDTEQSKYHCHKVMERILRLAGLPTDKDRDDFIFIVLREQTPDKRKQIIGYMLENMPDVGLLIIDGIRDLMYDINSPSESTDLINLLMRWSSGYNLHISPYDQGNRFNHEPLRNRRLLLHREEIRRLIGKVKEKGYALVPLKMYFTHGLVKMELALATGKKLYDKRQDLANKDARREMERAMKERNR